MDLLTHFRTNSDVIFIANLPVSTLLLFRDQRFRGYCILSFDLWEETSLDSLPLEEYTAFGLDLRTASMALRQVLRPDHMNYELLGNTNPHLHWHIVPRYRTDPRWGRPIWEGYPRNEFKQNRHTLADEEYVALIHKIQAALVK